MHFTEQIYFFAASKKNGLFKSALWVTTNFSSIYKLPTNVIMYK